MSFYTDYTKTFLNAMNKKKFPDWSSTRAGYLMPATKGYLLEDYFTAEPGGVDWNNGYAPIAGANDEEAFSTPTSLRKRNLGLEKRTPLQWSAQLISFLLALPFLAVAYPLSIISGITQNFRKNDDPTRRPSFGRKIFVSSLHLLDASLIRPFQLLLIGLYRNLFDLTGKKPWVQITFILFLTLFISTPGFYMPVGAALSVGGLPTFLLLSGIVLPIFAVWLSHTLFKNKTEYGFKVVLAHTLMFLGAVSFVLGIVGSVFATLIITVMTVAPYVFPVLLTATLLSFMLSFANKKESYPEKFDGEDFQRVVGPDGQVCYRLPTENYLKSDGQLVMLPGAEKIFIPHPDPKTGQRATVLLNQARQYVVNDATGDGIRYFKSEQEACAHLRQAGYVQVTSMVKQSPSSVFTEFHGPQVGTIVLDAGRERVYLQERSELRSDGCLVMVPGNCSVRGRDCGITIKHPKGGEASIGLDEEGNYYYASSKVGFRETLCKDKGKWSAEVQMLNYLKHKGFAQVTEIVQCSSVRRDKSDGKFYFKQDRKAGEVECRDSNPSPEQKNECALKAAKRRVKFLGHDPRRIDLLDPALYEVTYLRPHENKPHTERGIAGNRATHRLLDGRDLSVDIHGNVHIGFPKVKVLESRFPGSGVRMNGHDQNRILGKLQNPQQHWVPVSAYNGVLTEAEALKFAKDDSLSPTEKINRGAALKKNALSYGFICEDIKRDGNCLFRAVKDQFDKRNLKVGEETHITLRKKVADYIDANRSLTESMRPEKKGEYIANLRKLGTWGDHTELVAISNMFKVSIVLIRSDASPPTIIKPSSKVPQGTLVLGYEVGSHYQSLKDGFSKNTKREELLRNTLSLNNGKHDMKNGISHLNGVRNGSKASSQLNNSVSFHHRSKAVSSGVGGSSGGESDPVVLQHSVSMMSDGFKLPPPPPPPPPGVK